MAARIGGQGRADDGKPQIRRGADPLPGRIEIGEGAKPDGQRSKHREPGERAEQRRRQAPHRLQVGGETTNQLIMRVSRS